MSECNNAARMLAAITGFHYGALPLADIVKPSKVNRSVVLVRLAINSGFLRGRASQL
jgi:hypothetical protein